MDSRAVSVPGTRLDKLLALRSRLDHEIAVERRKEALADRAFERRRRGRGRTRLRHDDSVRSRLDQLGVTSLTVKQWAVREGYLLEVARGRVALAIIEKYAEAHTRRQA